MVRPCIDRKIENDLKFTCFKPVWIKTNEKVEIQICELEAFRLSNLEDLSNIEWAKKMWISAPTFNRLIKSAQKKIADALINWKKLRVYESNNSQKCDS